MAAEPIAIDVLWPDADAGPWLVTVWWRPQRGAATPVGIDVRAWLSSEGRAPLGRAGYPLPRAADDVEFGAIGSRLIRDLPIGRIVDETREILMRTSKVAHGATDVPHPALDDDAWRRITQDVADLVPRPEEMQPKRGGRDLGDAHYAEVAEVYRAAARVGQPPRKAVAEHFTVSESSAAKKIARARERGFLPKTSRGRIGRLTEEL